MADLFEGLCQEAGIGALFLQREAQLEGVRPDFAASIDGRPCGWVELKKPGHSLDGPSWRGREEGQWGLLAQLDSVLVCNGEAVRLYCAGAQVDADVLLPSDGGDWDSAPLLALLHLFTKMRPPVVRSVHQLAVVLAPMARLLRERVAAGLSTETPRPVIAQAKAVWAANVHEKVTDAEFASDLAQVIAYSLAIAALSGAADENQDGFVSLSEARQTLRVSNAVLAAALGPVLDIQGLSQELSVEIGAIERLVSVVDSRAIGAARDNRGEPWLWFYEDFLTAYDPVAREKAGVYYTPVDVVKSQVQHIDFILRKLFSKKLSFADASVVTLDPAAGSGTYPLAVIDQAERVAIEVRGAAGPKQVVKQLAANVIAFEILPGPYAVAQLRIGRRLADMDNSLFPPGNVRVYMTDTLEDPDVVPLALPLWGDVQVLAEERERARGVKHDQPVTVIVGNPPYERGVKADGKWVVNPSSGRSLFEDVIEPAQAAGIIFSAQASLYNHYVYFWRWALWKAFEQEPDSPAVVSFITASSWLNNPVFIGLRTIALEHADEIWVTDLGGEGRGNNAEDNVFAIQTPVAIVTVFRRAKDRKTLATVYYRRVSGKRAEKLEDLRGLSNPHESPGDWTELAGDARLGFVPIPPRTQWDSFPKLVDIFPWQQPGVKVNRAWPYATTKEVLRRRWDSLLEDPNSATR
ncbi:type ISP restriction/modification enzyme, partial [Cryobacterium sp. MLB-32]|uniref:type ISP restriction/modification enzyme n=1 Tax=Cryobacterium sp. MLB-32 TaxID=1529318 RepID=UPI0012E0A65C